MTESSLITAKHPNVYFTRIYLRYLKITPGEKKEATTK